MTLNRQDCYAMSFTRFMLFKLSALCRCRIISGANNEPYLERYHLLRMPFGYHCYLHRFIASDPGKGLHNHPWRKALSIVLSGGYREMRMDDAKHHNMLRLRELTAGNINWISGRIFHRIDIDADQECWSLFIHNQKTATWGFLDQNSHQYIYRDHDSILQKASEPDWWKQADRPMTNPDMRATLKPAMPAT